MPTYLSAISTVHQWFGLDYSAHDDLTSRLKRAWLISLPQANKKKAIQDFSRKSVIAWASKAAESRDVTVVRRYLVCVLDVVFFSRADYVFDAELTDYEISGFF